MTIKEQQAWRACAEWLAACLQLGWKHSELDFLEALWWKYHEKPAAGKDRDR